jgi:hypothetical protein
MKLQTMKITKQQIEEFIKWEQEIVTNEFSEKDKKQTRELVKAFNKRYEIKYWNRNPKEYLIFITKIGSGKVIETFIELPQNNQFYPDEFNLWYVFESIRLKCDSNMDHLEDDYPDIESYLMEKYHQAIEFFDDDTLMMLGVDCF